MREREPQDLGLEEALIGAAMLSRTVVDDASIVLDAGDFAKLAHQNIWHAIVSAHRHGGVDQLTVAAELAHMGWQGEEYTVAALNGYTINTPSISSATRYATVVADHALRRAIIRASGEVAALGWGESTSDDAGDALDRARTVLANLEAPHRAGAPDPDVTTFLDSVPTDYDWLFPDFLERRDRMLVTAAEGVGKSTLLAQIAVCGAAGLHPWTFREIDPINVLIIDLENSDRLVTRRLRTLAAVAGRGLNPARLRVNVRPDGLDLTKRADRLWLYDRVAANKADLLVIGPAYRMMAGTAAKGDTGGEDQTRTVTRALDEIRVRCDCALLMETHAPHGSIMGRDLRPFGSSVWLRWPEFGIGLHKNQDNATGNQYEVLHWRGPRDQRRWPASLHRSTMPGTWLWTPYFANARRAA